MKKVQGKGFEPLDHKSDHSWIEIIVFLKMKSVFFFCFNNRANNNRDKYLLGEGDSDSYLLTNLLIPYLLSGFFYVPVGKGHEFTSKKL